VAELARADVAQFKGAFRLWTAFVMYVHGLAVQLLYSWTLFPLFLNE
jgi:hypothetical protein